MNFDGITKLFMGFVGLIFVILLTGTVAYSFLDVVGDLEVISGDENITIVDDVTTAYESSLSLVLAFVGIIFLAGFYKVLMPLFSKSY